jgi:hypothetical protein
MSQNPNHKAQKRKKRDETASVVASISGYTPAYVRMVMSGTEENEKILEATILYKQGKSELIKHIEDLVPFN